MGDKAAEETILRHSAKLLKHLITQLDPNPVLEDDLYQEGLIALRCAIGSYRPENGTSWSNYASVAARRKMLNTLKVTRNAPTAANHAHSALRILDPAEDEPPDEAVFASCDRLYAVNHIQECLGTLEPRERDIVSSHFGIGCSEQPLIDIAPRLGITSQRAGQIKRKTLEKLYLRLCDPDSASPLLTDVVMQTSSVRGLTTVPDPTSA